LLPLGDAIVSIRDVRGRSLEEPKVIYADRGYDSEPHRQKLRKRGIKPVIARRGTEHGSSLGNFAGWSNVLMHGFTPFAVFAFALSVGPTFTKRF
jgi:IS5 family transposase